MENKINNFRNSLNNINRKVDNDFIKIVEMIILDKGYVILFESNIVNDDGILVNAIVRKIDKEIQIKINANSKEDKYFILVHEISHIIKTKKMIDYVYKFTKENYNIKYMEEVYNKEFIKEEIYADICGKLLGNKKFVSSLTQSKSIIKKLYEIIKRVLNNFIINEKYEKFLENLEVKWKNAYRNTTTKQAIDNLENIKFSEMYNNDGSLNRIIIDENIFENNNGKSINQIIEEYLKQHIGEVYTIIESGQKVYLGEDLPKEYAYSKSTQSLPISKRLAKGRATSNLEEIVENATNRKWEIYKHKSHKIDAKYGFYKYDTIFSFNHNACEKIYSGTILIRNDANGKKYLYDILNIQQQKKSVNLPSVASNSKKSSARFDGSSNQSDGNIPLSLENVKPSTKYFMQKDTKDTKNINNIDDMNKK